MKIAKIGTQTVESAREFLSLRPNAGKTPSTTLADKALDGIARLLEAATVFSATGAVTAAGLGLVGVSVAAGLTSAAVVGGLASAAYLGVHYLAGG